MPLINATKRLVVDFLLNSARLFRAAGLCLPGSASAMDLDRQKWQADEMWSKPVDRACCPKPALPFQLTVQRTNEEVPYIYRSWPAESRRLEALVFVSLIFAAICMVCCRSPPQSSIVRRDIGTFTDKTQWFRNNFNKFKLFVVTFPLGLISQKGPCVANRCGVVNVTCVNPCKYQ